MTISSMVSSNAFGKGKPDPSFSSGLMAKDAIAKYGKENIVDATLGVVKNEEGDFATLPTVEAIYRSLPGSELCDYAPIAGLPDFREAAIEYAFQGHQPKGTYARCVAIPGGSGGIHHVIFNYVERGEKFLIPDWHWGPYREMAIESERNWEIYQMFDKDNHFTLEDFKIKADGILADQESMMTIINTPAHNPSGYSMTNDDWKEMIDFFKTYTDKGKKIIILWDMAYTDYAGSIDETRDFLKYFDNMPENMLLTVAFSMSKSFLCYGMRSGALIGVSTSEDLALEFEYVNTFSNRATWSNGSRGAQKTLALIMADPELKKKTDEERAVYRELINKRAKIFMAEAAEAGLPVLPYQAGFFISVPAKGQFELVDKLREKNIFTIPLDCGAVRFAMSATPSTMVPGLAKITKELYAGHEV
jgi:Aspartate/tyrosine/aromatic aminotransferase